MIKAGVKFAQGVSLGGGYRWPDYIAELWEVMAKEAPERAGLQAGDRLVVLFRSILYECEANTIPSNHARPMAAALAIAGYAKNRELGELNFWVDKDGRPCSSGFGIGDTVTILEVRR